jgi:ornithine decarboxylase
MIYERMFRFLFCSAALDGTTLECQRLGEITEEVERLGFTCVRAQNIESGRVAVNTEAAIGCIVVEWASGRRASFDVGEFVAFVRNRGLETPIFILVRRHGLEEIPVDILGQVTGYIFLSEDSPRFIARNLASHLQQYANGLKTPFFGAMVDYAEQGNQVWTCPGHNGGVFYQKSPIGRVFVEHLGEAVFRNDLDNSVVELGDLLVHEGPALPPKRRLRRFSGPSAPTSC